MTRAEAIIWLALGIFTAAVACGAWWCFCKVVEYLN